MYIWTFHVEVGKTKSLQRVEKYNFKTVRTDRPLRLLLKATATFQVVCVLKEYVKSQIQILIY